MKKVALIPGSFKPPHRGHLQMISFYSKLVGSDGEVIVFVSNPKQKKYIRSVGETGSIPPDVSVKILGRYCQHLTNVRIRLSESSPVTDCYEYAKTAGEVEIIPGVSDKGNDVSRWKNMQEWLIKNDSPARVNLIPVPALDNLSSTDFRIALSERNNDKISLFLPDNFSINDFFGMIEIKSLHEIESSP